MRGKAVSLIVGTFHGLVLPICTIKNNKVLIKKVWYAQALTIALAMAFIVRSRPPRHDFLLLFLDLAKPGILSLSQIRYSYSSLLPISVARMIRYCGRSTRPLLTPYILRSKNDSNGATADNTRRSLMVYGSLNTGRRRRKILPNLNMQ